MVGESIWSVSSWLCRRSGCRWYRYWLSKWNYKKNIPPLPTGERRFPLCALWLFITIRVRRQTARPSAPSAWTFALEKWSVRSNFPSNSSWRDVQRRSISRARSSANSRVLATHLVATRLTVIAATVSPQRGQNTPSPELLLIIIVHNIWVTNHIGMRCYVHRIGLKNIRGPDFSHNDVHTSKRISNEGNRQGTTRVTGADLGFLKRGGWRISANRAHQYERHIDVVCVRASAAQMLPGFLGNSVAN